jgi:hypothetical protein
MHCKACVRFRGVDAEIRIGWAAMVGRPLHRDGTGTALHSSVRMLLSLSHLHWRQQAWPTALRWHHSPQFAATAFVRGVWPAHLPVTESYLRLMWCDQQCSALPQTQLSAYHTTVVLVSGGQSFVPADTPLNCEPPTPAHQSQQAVPCLNQADHKGQMPAGGCSACNY